MSQEFAADYIDVAARLVEFRRLHPDGSLQPANPAEPYKVQTIGEQTFIVYTAAAFRAPDDARPGIGIAWEPFPGRTPYTRNSELMNAETSAWGRAIVAALAGDTKKSVASAEEVRNRQAERDEPPAPTGPTPEQLRDAAVHPQVTRETLLQIHHAAKRGSLLATPVTDETGERVQLGDLIVRRGREITGEQGDAA